MNCLFVGVEQGLQRGLEAVYRLMKGGQCQSDVQEAGVTVIKCGGGGSGPDNMAEPGVRSQTFRNVEPSGDRAPSTVVVDKSVGETTSQHLKQVVEVLTDEILAASTKEDELLADLDETLMFGTVDPLQFKRPAKERMKGQYSSGDGQIPSTSKFSEFVEISDEEKTPENVKKVQSYRHNLAGAAAKRGI